MATLMDSQTSQVLIPQLLIAETFWTRAIGLLGRRQLSIDQAILLRPCRSVHTCFMRFPITIAFMDHEGTIVGLRTNVPPWRFISGPTVAVSTIEFSPGYLQLRLGQRCQVVGSAAG